LPPESDWNALIADAAAQRRAPRRAIRHDGGLTSASKPQKFTCDDNELYAVKFLQNQHGNGRAIFNEQVVALTGRLIGAPVPVVELVEVSPALADALRQDAAALGLGFDPQPGVHHGSQWVGSNVSDRVDLQMQYLDENRNRLGALEVLYCWLPCTSDHQWIYNNDPPHEVFSVDHTPFLPGGPDWTAEGLAAAVTNVALDPQLLRLALVPPDRELAVAKRQSVTDEQIAAVVAQPPDEWGVGAGDRSALASYMAARRALVEAACS